MSHILSLARRHRAALIATTLILGSAAPAFAANHEAESSIVLADARAESAAGQNREGPCATPFRKENVARHFPVQKPWPAPVGHRQPRASDIPVNVQLSSAEREAQRLDRELDKKLVICRGC